MDHDLVAGLPLRDAGAGLPDDPGSVGATDVVVLLGVVAEHRDRHAARGPDVVEVDARRHHAHDHLERPRLRDLDLLDLEGVLRLALALLRITQAVIVFGSSPGSTSSWLTVLTSAFATSITSVSGSALLVRGRILAEA